MVLRRLPGIFGVLLALAMSGTGSPASAADRYDALVVEGRHLNAESSRSAKSILELHLKLSVGTVRIEELDRTDFTGVKVMYFPGLQYLEVSLPQGAAENIRKAVAGGMGYIGTCGGSLIAAEATGSPRGPAGRWPMIGLFPGREVFAGGTGMRPYHFETTHPIVAFSSVAREIAPVLSMDYAGGPGNYIPGPDALPGLVHWVVAWQSDGGGDRTDRPAIVACLFGGGRVFLSTAHPERPRTPEVHRVIKLAAEWCVGKTDREKNRPPVAVMSVPERGAVAEELRFSAAGSDDPEGFPIGFIWNFADGSPLVYTPQATHAYAKEGTYTVTLIVTDGKDQTSGTRQVRVAGEKRTVQEAGASATQPADSRPPTDKP